MRRSERLARLLKAKPEDCRAVLATLSEKEQEEFQTHWRLWARGEQLAPEGDWRTWLIMAGRGFGKTRAGAEWVREMAETDGDARIALVGATLPEVRAVMVEGESGLLAISPLRTMPVFEPSLRRLVWPNGAQALLYSAGEPESLRGPQHSHACRPGAERGLRQRSPRPDRCPAPLHRGRREHDPASGSGRRGELAGSGRRDGRLGGTGLVPCLPSGRQLALRPPSRRHADLRSFHRPGPVVFRLVEKSFAYCGTAWRFDR